MYVYTEKQTAVKLMIPVLAASESLILRVILLSLQKLRAIKMIVSFSICIRIPKDWWRGLPSKNECRAEERTKTRCLSNMINMIQQLIG